MITVVGIDPGPTASGMVWFDGVNVIESSAEYDNEALRTAIAQGVFMGAAIVIERIQFYGKIAGPPVFDTIWWSGRFHEAALGAGHVINRVYWNDVKRQFVPSARRDESGKRKKITESDVRLGVLTKFGGEKAAKGTKAAPGPCRGVTSHAWSALALAVYWWMRSSSVGIVPPMKPVPADPALLKALKDIAEVDF